MKDGVGSKAAAYPSQYETEILLKDGSSMLLRPIRGEDTERWLALISRLSPRTKYLRFHHMTPKTEPDDAARFCAVDYENTFALVAEVLKEPNKELVAVGRYYRLPNTRSAELSLVVEDAYQYKGIGTSLIEHLAEAARDKGIAAFEADVLAENEMMLDVFKSYGFHITSELETGVYHVTFPITRTSRVEKRERERERVSALASLGTLISPRSVALIGASRHSNTIGDLLLRCMTQSGFTGKIYPVNPYADALGTLKAYPTVLDIPDNVDMEIIAVPAKVVAKVADDCGHKGVHSLVVISDGFREIGPEGASRERELRDIVFGHGMRMIGPNCMGVLNTHPSVRLNATFSLVYPPPGNVAFLSQSGAMGLIILEFANDLNMGISTFVSVGNRADISANDLLDYWEKDQATKVILLYLESFGEARKFARTARRVSAKKPIVVVKGGSTQAGSRAASSHTGAMATSDVASDVLFRYAGMIRANTMEELLDVASLLSNQPLPKGRRLVIVTNGGGPGIIAADASARNGLHLPELSQDTVTKLKSVVRRDIKINNPVDLTASGSAEEFRDVLKLLASDDDVDAVLTIFVPPILTEAGPMTAAIGGAAPMYWRERKTLLACFLGQRGFKTKLGSRGKLVPCYPFPEEAILALSRAVEYAEMRERPRGRIPRLRGIRRERARETMEQAMSRSSQRSLWLSPPEIRDLLECYGIRVVETASATTADEAAIQASKIGFPVAVKLLSSTISHKTDVGGVILDLNSDGEVKQAFNNITANLAKIGRDKEMEGVTLQRMVKGGVETIVGVTQDPSFGPLMMFGSGGIYAELVKDVSLRLHPLTDLDASEMVRSIKMAKLLEGYRGSPPGDLEAIEDLLLRLSAMVEDLPQIDELDFNPVKIMPKGEGYRLLDARIMVR